MLKSDNIKALAKLARIHIEDKESESLAKETSAILDYVGEIKKISGDVAVTKINQNVFREDDRHHLPGEYTSELLESSPKRQDEYVKVRKVL
jgi:aspartyl/glutamyl-tRNA(Asn/Gln) amidotransferase C subunit